MDRAVLAPAVTVPQLVSVPSVVKNLPELPVWEGDKALKAALAVDWPVPPSATAKSVIPVIEPPVMETLLAAWVAIDPRPKLVRAVVVLSRSERLSDSLR